MMTDTGQIQADLGKHGMNWERKRSKSFDVYFGEGMDQVWNPKSRLSWDGEEQNLRR